MFNIPTVTVASETLTSAASSVTLTYAAPAGVAWTPRHLLVRVQVESTAGTPNLQTRFNSDTGANYNQQHMTGAGSSPSAYRTSGGTAIGLFGNIAAGDSLYLTGGFIVPDAFSTRSHKAAIAFTGEAERFVRCTAGRWASTAAITSVTVFVDSSTMVAGSVIELCVVDESFNIDEQIKTAGTGAGTFTVSSISAADGDIVQIGNLRGARDAASDNYLIEFNGDTTTTNYQRQVFQGIDSTVNSGVTSANSVMHAAADGAAENIFGATLLHIPNYSDGANDRALNTLNGFHASASSSRAMVSTARWNNTAAITAIKMLGETTANFVVGSMLSTYAVPKNLIERQELGAAANITFADIPQTYDHLELSVYARCDVDGDVKQYGVWFNGETTVGNFERQTFYAYNATVAAYQHSSYGPGIVPGSTSTANVFGVQTVIFPNYTLTDRHQSALILGGYTTRAEIQISSSRWKNTAAITSIELICEANADASVNKFEAGSVFTLRGISSTITPASDITSINGIALASIASFNGITVANAEKLNGITF